MFLTQNISLEYTVTTKTVKQNNIYYFSPFPTLPIPRRLFLVATIPISFLIYRLYLLTQSLKKSTNVTYSSQVNTLVYVTLGLFLFFFIKPDILNLFFQNTPLTRKQSIICSYDVIHKIPLRKSTLPGALS